MTKTCKTCVYWDSKNRDKDHGTECRRYPPLDDEATWPVSNHYHWCGEHKIAEEQEDD